MEQFGVLQIPQENCQTGGMEGREKKPSNLVLSIEFYGREAAYKREGGNSNNTGNAGRVYAMAATYLQTSQQRDYKLKISRDLQRDRAKCP
jgi:hypothetical protein